MAAEGVKRKISAIVSADVVGYSRLMEADEEATVRTVESYRKTVSSIIEQHDGRVIDAPGDNILAELGSVVDAVQCSVEIQHVIKAKNAVVPEARRMEFRIGINLGDVIEEGDRTYGDGVNIASRIEGMADAGGICISESAYQQIKTKLSLGYEDLGEHAVKNISEPVRVYRISMGPGDGAGTVRSAGERKWRNIAIGAIAMTAIGVGAVVVWNSVLTRTPSQEIVKPETASAPAQGAMSAAAEKPSIAVLPFDNMSGDPGQEYFSDAITDEVISALSKNSMLTVIARNSTFTYKGKAVKVQQVGQELGVKHVLEGSVRNAGNRVRIIAQLVDATTGSHLWSETYERELEDIFATQAEIAQSIAATLSVEYAEAEWARVRRIPTDSLTAYGAYWRGRGHFMRFSREDLLQTRKHLERAVELDSNYADAYALLSIAYTQSVVHHYETDLKTMEQASNLSKKALSLDNSSLDAHSAQFFVYFMEDQCELALSEAEKAIFIDSNNSWGYNCMGLAHPFQGASICTDITI